MRVTILQSSPGCVFEVGQLIKVDDKKGLKLIEQGLAEYYNEPVVDQGAPPPPGKIISTHMAPPRWIHGCGRVFQSQIELETHAELGEC